LFLGEFEVELAHFLFEDFDKKDVVTEVGF
jgi:hypothetical protein